MAKSYDPIAPVAEEISEEASLLCFDEFQVVILHCFFILYSSSLPQCLTTLHLFIAVLSGH